MLFVFKKVQMKCTLIDLSLIIWRINLLDPNNLSIFYHAGEFFILIVPGINLIFHLELILFQFGIDPNSYF